jgi:ribosome-associated protein
MMTPDPMTTGDEIAIRGDTIRLGQLLKLAAIVATGAEVKALLAARSPEVWVNGEPETRRGRQLHPGDVVTVAGETLRIVGRAPRIDAAPG